MPVSVEMPLWKSHKKVHALQIDRVEGDQIHFVEAKTYGPRKVTNGLFSRYTPVHGDYFVVYEDGYESISPRQPFEDGYTRLTL